MELANTLYVRTAQGQVSGPLACRDVLRMSAQQLLGEGAFFSCDGGKWFSIKRLQHFLGRGGSGGGQNPEDHDNKHKKDRIVAQQVGLSEDGHVHEIKGLSVVMQRAQKAAQRVKRYFLPATALCFSACSCVLAGSFTFGASMLFGGSSPLFHLLVSLLPAVLLAAGFAHIMGNWLLCRLSGLSSSERRSLALHLPWNRTPKAWPKYFRRWVYCGDWLVDNFSADLLPYVRAFVTGTQVQSIEEELELWGSLMSCAKCNLNFEVGHSVRELACVQSLPAWAKEITPGMNLPELERSLGEVGHEWAVSLLKRAATRKRIFNMVNFSGDLDEVMFEFHYCKFDNDREGLMVIIRPHMGSDVPLEEYMSDAA